MTDKEWMERAIPFLESKLWTLSDILAFPLVLADDEFSRIMLEKAEKDHKELTDLLTHVDKL
jgi:hypothetical protein